MSTTIQTETNLIRSLVRQDRALDAEDGGGRLDLSGREAIEGWRKAAAEAGDDGLIDALNAMGDHLAAELWEEIVAA